MDSGIKWIKSLLYLALITSLLHLVYTHLISHKLALNFQKVRLKKQPELPLRFSSDGTFKILQVADMHYGNGVVTRCRDVLKTEVEHCSDLNTTRFLRKMIEAEKPDFVVFTEINKGYEPTCSLKINISHGRVCIFILGVLVSCVFIQTMVQKKNKRK